MGQQQSKDELLYQQVNYGNTEGIKALRSDGASLEWIDKEGKTPLIVACMDPGLYNVAKTLIELGANVNGYRPGRHAGTPLHHAAKRSLEQTVKLLLSCGANALVMNDDCQTPLDVARTKGYSNVVRAIEGHIRLYSGWLREIYGPGFLELLAPQLLSRKVWVVVLPCGSRNLTKPFKLELAIYTSPQDAQPRALIPLWKANMEEPKFNQPDPAVIITDNSTKSRIKLATVSESDKQQLQWFCNACKGIPQVMHSSFPFNTQSPVLQATAPPNAEDLELTMAITASLQNPPPHANTHPTTESYASTSGSNNENALPPTNNNTTLPDSFPSAPPLSETLTEDEGPIHYPSINTSPIDLPSQTMEKLPLGTEEKKEGESGGGSTSSSCVICLDAPVEGACIPCGHMAGCMSCLNEIKGKKWGCPVCRAKIDQIVRLYAV